MASSSNSERERQLLEALWEGIPKQASEILGTDVALGPMAVEDVEPDKQKQNYLAILSTEQPQAVDMFLIFDVKSAIAFSGLLVMMQEKVIREKMGRREMGEDDLDAMGECINQIGSVITDAVRQVLGPEYHMRFGEGVIDNVEALEKYASQRIIGASGRLTIGSLHSGKLLLAIPEQMVIDRSRNVEQVAAPLMNAATSALGGGVELSPEEAAAIRQVTMAGLAASVPTVALLLPIERERPAWEERLDKAGLPYVVARDVHTVRRLLRSGEAGMVIIDADACPSGGLAALAQVLTCTNSPVPVFLAASNPTRVHVVSSLAAGAVSYFVKPLDSDEMRTRIEDVVASWQT